MSENNTQNENNVFSNGGFSQFEAADGPLNVSNDNATDESGTVVAGSDISEPTTVTEPTQPQEIGGDENGAASFKKETFIAYTVTDNAEEAPTSTGGYVYKTGPITTSQNKQKGGALNTVSSILFGLSIPALLASFIAMFVQLIVGAGGGVIVFSLVLAISNIAIGAMLRKSHKGGTKNLVLGIIATAFSFMMLIISNMDTDIFDFDTDFENEYDSVANEYMETAEGLLGIDFPEYDDFYETNNGFNFVYENDSDFTDIVAMAAKNRKFISVSYVPTAFVGMLPEEERAEYFDYCLFYNLDTGEWNTLPTVAGKYRMMCITVTEYSYYENEGEVGIYIYDLDHVNYVDSDF